MSLFKFHVPDEEWNGIRKSPQYRKLLKDARKKNKHLVAFICMDRTHIELIEASFFNELVRVHILKKHALETLFKCLEKHLYALTERPAFKDYRQTRFINKTLNMNKTFSMDSNGEVVLVLSEPKK